MYYFLAIILPPVAILLCGRLLQFIVNFVLTGAGVVLWILFPNQWWLIPVAMIHALLVVNTALGERRAKRMMKALKKVT